MIKKKALLINPGYNNGIWNEMYPTGALTQLASITIEMGWDVEIIQCVTDRVSHEGVVEWVKSEQPDLIGISLTTFQTQPTKELSRMLKQITRVPIVAGGVHISSIKDQALVDFPDVDYFVDGGAESLWCVFLSVGVWGERRVIKGTTPDLNNIPFPDYSHSNTARYFGASPPGEHPSMFMMASRGCPFLCSYCSKAVYGSTVRYKNPEYVVKELEYLKEQGFKEVFFQDDTLNMNRAWLEEILDRIISAKLDMKFRCPFRANEKLVDVSLLQKMKKAGFWLIFYGVESGNQEMLDKMGKGLKLEEIERAFQLTKGEGIKTEASFIIGLMGDTPDTVQETYKFYRKLDPFWAGFSIAMPFPGTRYYNEVKEAGYLLETDFDKYTPERCIIRNETLSRDTIVETRNSISKEVQKRNLAHLVMCTTTLKWSIKKAKTFYGGRN